MLRKCQGMAFRHTEEIFEEFAVADRSDRCLSNVNRNREFKWKLLKNYCETTDTDYHLYTSELFGMSSVKSYCTCKISFSTTDKSMQIYVKFMITYFKWPPFFLWRLDQKIFRMTFSDLWEIYSIWQEVYFFNGKFTELYFSKWSFKMNSCGEMQYFILRMVMMKTFHKHISSMLKIISLWRISITRKLEWLSYNSLSSSFSIQILRIWI